MRSALLLIACLQGAAAAEAPPAERWVGVDEAVVKRIATDAGRPPREPLINTDQGDLLLFLFLAAGAVGGFVAGWTARGLFGKQASAQPMPPRCRRSADGGEPRQGLEIGPADRTGEAPDRTGTPCSPS